MGAEEWESEQDVVNQPVEDEYVNYFQEAKSFIRRR
jgi:hypothetical protein